MFWPDMARETALANLRQVLHDLRHALKPAAGEVPLLAVGRDSIRLDPAAQLGLDTEEFSAPATACPATPCAAYCTPCLAHMETLVGSYGGAFMAGFSLAGCPDFEEWLQVRRESLHLRVLLLLTRLADCHGQAGAYAKALPFAQRFLELEPWNEEGLRRTMRLFALNGQSALALASYEKCCLTLQRELGVLPSAETRHLADRIRDAELSPTTRRKGDAPESLLAVAERRQVTVLYCELVPVEFEDPDTGLVRLREPLARASEIIGGRSGYLVQAYGGSLLAYFGYPKADENAARHAVQAALTLTHVELDEHKFGLRVGIHSGVVISSDEPPLPDAVGTTSRVAIRLQQLAQPGQVVISNATHHLVSGYFEVTSIGSSRLPDVGQPVAAFRVDGSSGARDRLEATTRLAPLIGRDGELAALLEQWQAACAGSQRIVLVRGEAGIGKSRLLLALKDALSHQRCTIRELRCYAEHSQSPFHPLIGLFEQILGFTPIDTPEARLKILSAFVEENYAGVDAETVPLLAKLLSLPLRAPYREPASSPQLQREKTLTIILDRLYALAAQKPVLLLVEDLHWIDPSTLELLQRFSMQERPGTLLAVFTARPTFQPSWHQQPAQTLALAPLDDDDTATLIRAIAHGIESENVRSIVERADGIPLFAEELAGALATGDASAIPATLQDLLAARIDSMGSAKFLAQTAATIGREFSLDLLRKIARGDNASLMPALRRLLDSGLLHAEGTTHFYFKHSLLRDAAYRSQTRPEREAAHRRIAAALVASGTNIRPELLARHWSEGGEPRKAIACWMEAGKLASRHSACQEALMHFRSGLSLIEALPEGAERERLEIESQIGLGAAACAVHGYASAEGSAAYARALELCGRHNGAPETFPAIWGLWASASSRVGYAGALELAQRLLGMALRSGDLTLEQQGHFAIGNTLFWQGNFHGAREHLERVRMTYQPDHHDRHVAQFGEDAGVTAGAYLSWVLWFLGFPDQARRISEQTLALARQLDHPFSLAYALTFASILNCRLRRPEEASALAQETLSLSDSHGFPLWQIGATLSRGWALAMQKRRQGVKSLSNCVDGTRAAMGGVTLVVLEPLLDSHVALGDFATALQVCDEAIAVGDALDDHHVEAELHRLRGEALLGLADTNAVEAAECFNRALDISRRQQAKSLELRATASMARLLAKQRKPAVAQRMLEQMLNRFTEGSTSPDLRNGRKMLASLADTRSHSSRK